MQRGFSCATGQNSFIELSLRTIVTKERGYRRYANYRLISMGGSPTSPLITHWCTLHHFRHSFHMHLPHHTEGQHVSFVGSTNEDCHPRPLCNLRDLHAVPPYSSIVGIRLVPGAGAASPRTISCLCVFFAFFATEGRFFIVFFAVFSAGGNFG